MRAFVVSLFVVVSSFSGCSCGDVIVLDGFDKDSAEADVLHTYAVGGKVGFKVAPIDGFDMDRTGDPTVEGAIALDDDVDVNGGGDTLTFGVITKEVGDGTIVINDVDGNEIARRDVEVSDVDRIELAVTAPSSAGLELPAVDPTKIRIYAGSKAAFRASLFNGDDEVFATDAVTAEGASIRPCTGCTDDTCEASRGAVEFNVGSGEPVAVTLSAGSAATLAVTLVPTEDADVTDVTIDQGDEFEGKKSLVARVLAGTEPVFGAPVVWNVDGADLADEDNADFPFEGDVLQFKSAATTHQVIPKLGDRELPALPLQAQDFEVTAITFACGAAPASCLPLVLCLLALRRRRR